MSYHAEEGHVEEDFCSFNDSGGVDTIQDSELGGKEDMCSCFPVHKRGMAVGLLLVGVLALVLLLLQLPGNTPNQTQLVVDVSGAQPVTRQALQRPIVGILTLPCEDNQVGMCTNSYLAASYVKAMEAAGLRVAALQYYWPAKKLKKHLHAFDGILLTGGGANLTEGSDYWLAVDTIYDFVMDTNLQGGYYPLWGTCLGFEAIMVLQSKLPEAQLLGNCDAENITLPLDFELSRSDLLSSSKMFHHSNYAADVVVDILRKEPVTMNNHMKSITPELYWQTPALHSFFRLISTNTDRQGVRFVSAVESKDYPIYAVQFHPEKNSFEWYTEEVIDHSQEAIFYSAYMGQFFAREIRNGWIPSDDGKADEPTGLIYLDTWALKYTDSDFTEVYFW